MSIKRKIAVPALMALFCALCIFTALTVVKAEETNKKITGSGYTVTIPAEVNVGSDGTGEMEVSGTVLPYHKLNVEVASTNDYKLICGSQKIAYTISEDDQKFTYGENSAEYTTFTKDIKINAPAASTVNISGEYTDTLTFTMTCTPTEYFTLTYDANSGTFSDNTTTRTSKKEYAYGEAYGDLPTDLTRANCSFSGWFDIALDYDNNNVEANQVTSKSTITGDTTIYAHWSGTWNVIIKSNGGTLWVKDKNIISGASEESPVSCDSATIKVQYYDGAYNNLLINAVKEGYTCTGYFDDTTEGHKVWEAAGGAYVGSDSIYYKNFGGSRGAVWVNNGIKAGDTFTFYPQWQANTYTIQYDANEGTGTMNVTTCTYDMETSLTTNDFTREGYIFTGWNTSAAGTGTSYTDGETVKNLTAEDKGTITLYAQWTEDTNSNDTTEDETPDAPADTAAETANVPGDAALPETVNEETEEPQA